MEHDAIKIDTIKYYLSPNATALKLCDQKYNYVTVK